MACERELDELSFVEAVLRDFAATLRSAFYTMFIDELIELFKLVDRVDGLYSQVCDHIVTLGISPDVEFLGLLVNHKYRQLSAPLSGPPVDPRPHL